MCKAYSSASHIGHPNKLLSMQTLHFHGAGPGSLHQSALLSFTSPSEFSGLMQVLDYPFTHLSREMHKGISTEYILVIFHSLKTLQGDDIAQCLSLGNDSEPNQQNKVPGRSRPPHPQPFCSCILITPFVRLISCVI